MIKHCPQPDQVSWCFGQSLRWLIYRHTPAFSRRLPQFPPIFVSNALNTASGAPHQLAKSENCETHVAQERRWIFFRVVWRWLSFCFVETSKLTFCARFLLVTVQATKEQWWRRRFQKRANPPPLLHLHLDGNDDDYDDDYGVDDEDDDCQFWGGLFFKSAIIWQIATASLGTNVLLPLFLLQNL